MCEMAKQEQIRNKIENNNAQDAQTLKTTVMLKDSYNKSLFYSSETNIRVNMSNEKYTLKYQKFIDQHRVRYAEKLQVKMEERYKRIKRRESELRNNLESIKESDFEFTSEMTNLNCTSAYENRP
jgi:hypothetical protein